MKHAILGFLIDQPMHGYALKRALSPALPPERRVNDGVLYPLLQAHGGGGIGQRKRVRARRAARRDRHVFHATAKGRREFEQWLVERGRRGRRGRLRLPARPSVPDQVPVLRRADDRRGAREARGAAEPSAREARDVRGGSATAWSSAGWTRTAIAVLDLGIAQQKREGAMAEANDRATSQRAARRRRHEGEGEHRPRAIDMWAPIVPVPGGDARTSRSTFPKEMAGYLRVFYKREPRREEFARRRGPACRWARSTVIASLDAAGIERTLITGFDEWSSVHETFIPNELVAGLAERHPDRFIPFAGADVLKGMEAVREFEQLVARPRLPRPERAAVHDRPAGRRPSLLPAVREVRRARRAGQHPHLGELDHGGGQRPRPPAPHRRGRGRLPGAEDHHEPRRLPVGARGGAAGLEVPERVPRAGRAPAAATSPRRARAGSRCCGSGPRTIREKVLFGTGWFLLGRPPGQIVDEFRALPGRRGRDGACGCGATPSALLGAAVTA